MKKIFPKLFLIIILSTYLSCSQTTEPKPQEYKDPRDMTWTFDTLQYQGSFQTLLNSIWGSSTESVYVVGHNYDNAGKFWHYDGERWQCINIFDNIASGNITLDKIYGFEENDFWIVGKRERIMDETESLIVHRGDVWSDYENLNNQEIINIQGSSSTDIWFCGVNGIILHNYYDYWTIDTISINKTPDTNYMLTGIAINDNDISVIGVSYNPYNYDYRSYFIRGNINDWSIIDSTISLDGNWSECAKWGDNGIYQTKQGDIYSYGSGGIWHWNNDTNGWDQQINGNFVINSMNGPDKYYLLAVAAFGRLLYFSGNNWTELLNLFPQQEDLDLVNVWSNGNEIFIVAHSSAMNTIIIHGK